MFKTHQKLIQKFAQDNSENMARVITFVYSTIQQSLYQTPNIMAEIDEQGVSSPFLWGWKHEAFNWIEDNKDSVFETSMELSRVYPNPNDARHELLKYFASKPGLGLVKGGFTIQLCFGLSGCIDSHNAARFGYNTNAFNANRFKSAKTEITRNRLVTKYHELIDQQGGSESLWNSWCNYVADNQPKTYDNGFHVSRIHCEAIGIL